MNKPFTMVVKETQLNLAKICNESELPLPVLDLIIHRLYSEIHSLTEKQSLEEERIYMSALKNADSTLGEVNETEE